MGTVYDVRGKAHIYRSLLCLSQRFLYGCKILGSIYLRAEQLSRIKGSNVLYNYFIKGILRVTAALFGVTALTVCTYPVKPPLPLTGGEPVQRLRRCSSLAKELDPHFFHSAVSYDRLEIFLGELCRQAHRHAASIAGDDLIENRSLKNKVAVHKYDIISAEKLLRKKDRIYVIGLCKIGIMYEFYIKREPQIIAIADQLAAESPRSYYNICDTCFCQHCELTAEYSLAVRYLRHAFRLCGSKAAHAASSARIKYNSSHILYLLLYNNIYPRKNQAKRKTPPRFPEGVSDQ